MKITGHSEDRLLDRDRPDQVAWDLRFSHQLDRDRGSSGHDKALGDALLHAKRLPDVTVDNSAPQLFATDDYIQIHVDDGSRGWVKNGEFPTRLYTDTVCVDPLDIQSEPKMVGVKANTRLNAENGFKAALDWAKFRTMALASTDALRDKLKQEVAGWAERLNNLSRTEEYRAHEDRRYRVQHAFEYLVDFLPDVRTKTGPTALRPYYQPGFLEAAAALALEPGVQHAGGARDRPISYARAQPIEILAQTGKSGSFDAVLPVKFCMYGIGDDERIDRLVEGKLREHFDVTVGSCKGSEAGVMVRFPVKDAHNVLAEVAEGSAETYVHEEIGRFIDAMSSVHQRFASWNDSVKPALEAGYDQMVKGAQDKHFADLDRAFEHGKAIRGM